MWIVGIIKWIVTNDGRHEIIHCNCHTFRSKDNALLRSGEVMAALEREGYSLHSINVPPNEEYIGALGYIRKSLRKDCSDIYSTVFINKN